MNKRFATVFAITALLLPYSVQAKPTWVVEHARSSKATANLKKQLKCTTALAQWEQSFEDVKDAATDEQKRILTDALNEAKRLCQQDQCDDGLAVLIAVKDVLRAVQNQWIDNGLEALKQLSLGPSSVEQRAMLRENMRRIQMYQKKGYPEKAIELIKISDESFDTPPALTPKQLRRARYEDAMESIDLLYGLADPMVQNDPQKRRLLETVNTRSQRDIFEVFRNAALDDAAQEKAYEAILAQAETDLKDLLTVKKKKTTKKK